MSNSNEIRVLCKFGPLLRLLEAYNRDHFRHRDWRSILRSVLVVFAATLITILMFSWLVLPTWYLIECDANLQTIVIALPIMISALQLKLTFIALMVKNRVVTGSIGQLQIVVNQRGTESKQSHGIYATVESNHVLLTTSLLKIFIGTISGLYVSAAMLPTSYAIFGYPPPQYWRLPVDTHSLLGRDNYIGFYVDWAIQSMSTSSAYVIVYASGSIYVGAYLYINGMVKDLEMRIMSIGMDSTEMPLNQKQMWSVYVREIDFHIEIIGVMESLCEMMEVILFNITLTCTIVLALSLFVVEIKDGISVEVLIASIDVCTMVALTFAYFYLAERITADLLDIGGIFYYSAWYGLPTRQQRLLMLPIQRAQREVRLTGLGFFDCSLVMFAKIIRSAASYFLMIRRL